MEWRRGGICQAAPRSTAAQRFCGVTPKTSRTTHTRPAPRFPFPTASTFEGLALRSSAMIRIATSAADDPPAKTGAPSQATSAHQGDVVGDRRNEPVPVTGRGTLQVDHQRNAVLLLGDLSVVGGLQGDFGVDLPGSGSRVADLPVGDRTSPATGRGWSDSPGSAAHRRKRRRTGQAAARPPRSLRGTAGTSPPRLVRRRASGQCPLPAPAAAGRSATPHLMAAR